MHKQRTPPCALGLHVRTGKAVVVAVGGPPDDPRVLGKTRIDVATTFDEGAVFHMGQEMPLDQARRFVESSEKRFVARARAGLKAFIAGLDARVVGAALVAPPPRKLPPFEAILKAHPLVHAAEGELYRRVFAGAVTALLAEPPRVAADALAPRTAAALKLAPAKVTARLAAMGKASGRPWAAEQKQAALAAWLILATSST